jgi:hypothetical protein
MAHVGPKQKLIAISAAFVILIGYLAVVAFANDDPSSASQVFSDIENDPNESVEGQWDRDTEGETNLYTYLQLMEFDATDGVAVMRIFPFPGKTWGDAGVSSFTTNRTFLVDVDAVGSRPIGEDSGNCWKFDADFIYGACDYTLDVPTYRGEDVELRTIQFYPFDKYLVNVDLTAEIGEGKTYDDEQDWKPLPIRPIEYTGRIGDFKATWTLTDTYGGAEFTSTESAYASLDKGRLTVDVGLTRSLSTILIVVVLMLFNIGAASMLAVMAWSVYVGHRPPTLGSLVWGAATIFTMLQSRQDIFPSNPPIGVGMDLWFFFPALFISLLSTSALFALWIRRSDWMA